MFIGILLIAGGVVWLLSNLGIISAEISDVIWPIVMIIVGLKFILKKSHSSCDWCYLSSKNKKE